MNNKNIVVGVDFSNSSLNAFRHAISLALKTGADMHLVWVKTPDVIKNAEDGEENYIKKMQTTLEEWRDLCRMESPNTEVNTVILEGKVHVELPKYASNLSNPMIVVGTHGASGFEEGYIGNNANRLIKAAKVPILIMRENIEINFFGNEAYYSPSKDFIRLPEKTTAT